MNKRWVSIGLSLILSFTLVSGAFADTLGEQKDKLGDVQDRIEELKDQINDVKDEKKDVAAEISKITNDVDKLQDDIKKLNSQIFSTRNDIKKATKEYDEAVEAYDAEKDLYGQRLKAMYISGPSGYLEILMTSQSFSEFISNTDIVKKVIEYDKNILMKMQEQQKSIQSKKEKLEEKQKQLSSMQASIDEKKKKLLVANAEKQKYYNKLQSDEAALKKVLNEEEAESKRIEAEIQAIMRAQSGNSGNYSGTRAAILKYSEAAYIRPTSSYGWRIHPVLKTQMFHSGMDIGVPTGTPVYSMSDGKVIISKLEGSYGNYIVIDHGGGVSTLYAHLSERLVSVGQTVSKGQLIAKSGSTGRSTGPHLHFEVRINGSVVDPAPYVILGK